MNLDIWVSDLDFSSDFLINVWDDPDFQNVLNNKDKFRLKKIHEFELNRFDLIISEAYKFLEKKPTIYEQSFKKHYNETSVFLKKEWLESKSLELTGDAKKIKSALNLSFSVKKGFTIDLDLFEQYLKLNSIKISDFIKKIA